VADIAEHTGGMLALVPDNADALVVEGGDPAGELHLTLLYLGDDVTGWGDGQADRLRELVSASAPALDPVDARVMGHAQFNPDGGPDGDREPCAVYLIGDSSGLEPLRQWAAWVTSTHDDYPTPPPQHTPTIYHVTAGYGIKPDQLTYTGPVRFGTLRLALAGDVLDVPLGDTEAPVTAVETKSGEITFTPPQGVIEVAAILPGPIARLVAEGKALNSRGVDWVAEHCGEQGSAWATEMRARAGEIETKRAAGTGMETTSAETDDIEVKIASPDPRAVRLRQEWAHNPKLTKLWKPGKKGDFKRLRKRLAKYVHTPKILNGLAANIHKLATGQWPGKNAHTSKGNVGKAMNMGRTVGHKSLVTWPEDVEFKAAVLDLDEAALFEGIEQWGGIFAEPWVDAYLADLDEAEADEPDDGTDEPADGEPGTVDLRADTARLASLGARLVVDPPPSTVDSPETSSGTTTVDSDGPLRLFDAEPVTT
jgi:hypothetical protein